MSTPYSSLYESYAESGLGEYGAPLGSEREARAYDLNYAQWLPAVKSDPILDIGCGAGHFLHWVRELGYGNASGVDVSQQAIKHCQERDLPVKHVADLTSYLDAHTGLFRLIVMNDVIEHIPREDLVDLLARVRDALLPEGRLLVKTLNCATLGGLYLRYADYTHTGGFTDMSLRQVLVATRFTSIVVAPYNVPRQGPKRGLYVLVLWLWSLCFGLIMLVEAGPSLRPRVRTRTMLAVAVR